MDGAATAAPYDHATRGRRRPRVISALLVLTATTALMCAAPPAALATGWSGPVSVSRTQTPNAVSCPISGFCMVTDVEGDVMTDVNGVWSGTNLGQPLTGVSCITPLLCVAVNQNGGELTYTGNFWQQRPLGGLALGAVGCAPDGGSGVWCLTGSSESNLFTYDGRNWSGPVGAGYGDAPITSISCTEGQFCVAVDTAGDAMYTAGSSFWTVATFYQPLVSVSCASGYFCEAVDSSGTVYTFDGYQWSDTAHLAAPLTAISCAGDQTPVCVAVDSDGDVFTQTDGGDWAEQSGLPTANGGFVGVSCASALFCVAIDTAGNAFTYTLTAPLADSPPTVSGTAQQGDTLTAVNGSWQDDPVSYGYQWQDCTADTCTDIGGANDPTYVLASSDVGRSVDVVVTATNLAGSGGATSVTTAAVIALAPVASSPPSVTGTLQQGSTLTAGRGTWSNSPTTYTYQWQDCSAACTSIIGATNATYTLGSGDVGNPLDVVVTATNTGGSAAASSARTAAVLAPTPVVVTATTPTTSPTAPTTTPTRPIAPTAVLAVVADTPTHGGGVNLAITLPANSTGAVTATPRSARADRLIGALTIHRTATGHVLLHVAPSATARRVLNAGHTVRVTVIVVFHPTTGPAVRISTTVTLRPRPARDG